MIQTEANNHFDAALDETLRAMGGKPVGDEHQQTQQGTGSVTEPLPQTEPVVESGQSGQSGQSGKVTGSDGEPASKPVEQSQPEWKMDLSSFSKWAGQEFKDEDSIKSSLKSVQELSALKEQMKELESIKARNQELEQSIDPRTHFVNEAEFKRQMILRKYPDKDPGIIGAIATMDLDKADNLETLALAELLETPNMVNGKEGALEVVKARLGLEGERQDWSVLQQNRLLSEANKARRELKQYQNVELPGKVDFDALKQAKEQEAAVKAEALTKTWSQVTKNLLDNFSKYDITKVNDKGEVETLFSYEVPAEFKKDFADHMTKYMVSNNLPFTDDNVKTAMKYRDDVFFLMNRDNILEAYAKKKVTEARDLFHKEVHNPKPVNSNERPPDSGNQENAELHAYATFKDQGSFPSHIGKNF